MTSEKQLREISQKIDALFASAKKDEGLALLDSAIAEAKDNDAYKLFFEGERAHYTGDQITALDIEAQAATLRPKDCFLLRNHGVILSNLDREEEAIELYDKALKIKPEDYQSLRNKGVSLSKLDRDAEAIELYDKALKINSEDYHSLRQKGVSLSKLDREKEAIELFDKALKVNSEDYQSLLNKGISLSKLDREKEAIELLDQSLKINPEDYQSLRQKGVSFSKLDRRKEAIELFDKALKIKPEDYQSLLYKGVALSELNREDEALEIFDKALKINPEDYYNLRQKGVVLSKLNREEEAMELFDKALKINHEDYQSLQQKGVSLSKLDREGEAIKLFDKALKINHEDYHSLRQKGVSLSKLDREEEAIELFDKALKINPKDYHSLRQKGVSLSDLDSQEEAIELFDKALKINPEDYHSLRNKGVSLSKIDRLDEAIELFDKALKINPDDYHSLRNIGVVFSKLNREEEAIEFYDKALKINSKDYHSLRNKGVSLFNIGNKLEAYDFLQQALKINPTSEQLKKDASYIFSQLSEQDQQQRDPKEKKPDSSNVGGLRGFIQTVREEFKNEIGEFERKKAENEKHLLEFIGADSLLKPDSSVFLVLRKWNSYTPALPLDDGEKSVGGGYFIYHCGKGTVIDPGYNFIENFQKAGCRLMDIDNIVITHAHNDHTIDFESLLTLLYQSYKGNTRTSKKVTLYLNQGAMLKFASLLDWRARRYIGKIFTINPGDTYRLSDDSTKMTVLPAYHDEIVTRYYSVGLHFSISFGEADNRNLLLTSDTGLYPPGQKNASKTEIHQLYKQLDEGLVNNIDLLVPHLGSIGKKELSAVKDMDWQPKDLLYGNHLGVLGVLRLISAIKPELALVSEFGEELKNFREDLIKIMRKVMQKVMPDNPINVLPADLPFIYDIQKKTVFCVDGQKMIPAAKIKFEEEDGTFYYYYDDHKRKKFHSLKHQFENTTQRPYLT